MAHVEWISWFLVSLTCKSGSKHKSNTTLSPVNLTILTSVPVVAHINEFLAGYQIDSSTEQLPVWSRHDFNVLPASLFFTNFLTKNGPVHFPKGSWRRELPLFQGNLDGWNIINIYHLTRFVHFRCGGYNICGNCRSFYWHFLARNASHRGEGGRPLQLCSTETAAVFSRPWHAGFRDPTHDGTSPEKENPWKILLFSGKSRWVKWYYLARKFSHDIWPCVSAILIHLDRNRYIFIQGFLWSNRIEIKDFLYI